MKCYNLYIKQSSENVHSDEVTGYLTIMYQSRGPYQICKAPRAVRPEGFSNLIWPEGLVHNCFRIPLHNVFYSMKMKCVAFMP